MSEPIFAAVERELGYGAQNALVYASERPRLGELVIGWVTGLETLAIIACVIGLVFILGVIDLTRTK